MALWSRRTLQRFIDENSLFLAPKTIARHVTALNGGSDDPIATEWEVALLNAFGRCGRVLHEESLGGSSRLDIHFSPADGSQPFVMDVAAVSDRYLYKENPYQALEDELWKHLQKLRKRGVKGGFSLSVGHHPLVVWRGDKRPKLKLPPVDRIRQEIFNARWHRFTDKIAKEPNVSRVFEVKNEKVEVTIVYDPRSSSISGDHLNFTLATTKRGNPVFNALADKARQLKRSGFSSPAGIVLCDGDCNMLRDRSTHPSYFSAEEIISDFLRKHRSIAFVVTLTVAYKPGTILYGPIEFTLRWTFFRNPSVGDIEHIFSNVSRAMTAMPLPIEDAQNARGLVERCRRFKRGYEDQSFISPFKGPFGR